MKQPELEEMLLAVTPKVKILVLDIETSPMEAYVWQLWKQVVGQHQVFKDWAILSWAAKWLCGSKIYSQVVGLGAARKREDKRIMPRLWELMDKADIIIGHNVEKFDIRKINTRMLINGYAPPSPFQTIDTYKAAKRNFAFSSNKMSYLNEELGLQGKLETNFQLWKRCVTGDKAALMEMVEYNRYDTLATEDLYFKFRPWIKSHPNIGLYVESSLSVCSVCGNHKLTENGDYVTPAGKYRAYRCGNCGAIGRSRYNNYDPEKRHTLIRSIAR